MTGLECGVDAAFVEYRRTRSPQLRNALVEHHLHLAEHQLRRYRERTSAIDDLRQVAHLAVLHAVERFDPSLGYAFSTFAGRTVEGEIKRWFRDRSWSVRPPRRAQELHLAVRRAEEELTQSLGRSPTVAELAQRLGYSSEEVIEGIEAGRAYRSSSIDRPTDEDDDQAPTVAGTLGVVDERFDHIDLAVWLAGPLADLPARERSIIEMRFGEGLSQPEIAARVGVSQSYLSRLLRRTLLDLREAIVGDGALSGDAAAHDAVAADDG